MASEGGLLLAREGVRLNTFDCKAVTLSACDGLVLVRSVRQFEERIEAPGNAGDGIVSCAFRQRSCQPVTAALDQATAPNMMVVGT
jgi:hypothetical protein